MPNSQRIEYFDLSKGICILLVVAGHCGCPIDIPGYEIVRMPLYFILSGMFFKDYGGFQNLLIKKANKILVPFVFFYLLGCVFYYAIKWVVPGMLVTASGGVLDVFNNRQFFNGPIWFLLCLFWCNLLFCIIHQLFRSDIFRIICVVVCGVLGWYMGYCDVFIPMFIDVAFTALPFFAFGYYLKISNLLSTNRSDKYNLIFAFALWGISFLLFQTTTHRLSLHYNKIEGWSTYIIAVVSVLSILYVCKSIKRLPYISYVGRYSIVLLCVHHLINRPLTVLLSKIWASNSYLTEIVALCTILLSTLCIPFLKRYLPWAIAQKDLINNGSQHTMPSI